MFILSLPSRERGLKLHEIDVMKKRKVAPFAGAWIEMLSYSAYCILVFVAPFAGAWIEIYKKVCCARWGRSLPSRERGLKSCPYNPQYSHIPSLPSRERGLKFGLLASYDLTALGRSLRGSVD